MMHSVPSRAACEPVEVLPSPGQCFHQQPAGMFANRQRATPTAPDVVMCLLIRQYLLGGSATERDELSFGSNSDDVIKLGHFLSSCLLTVDGSPSLLSGPVGQAPYAIEAFPSKANRVAWLGHPILLRQQLERVLTPQSAAAVFQNVQNQLNDITSPASVADLFRDLKALMADGGTELAKTRVCDVQRDSACGRYLRRQILDFERMLFAGVSLVFNRLERMRQSASTPAPRSPTSKTAVSGVTTSATHAGIGEPGGRGVNAVASVATAVEALHHSFDVAVQPLAASRGTIVTQHASLRLGAYHLSQGHYQSASAGKAVACACACVPFSLELAAAADCVVVSSFSITLYSIAGEHPRRAASERSELRRLRVDVAVRCHGARGRHCPRQQPPCQRRPGTVSSQGGRPEAVASSLHDCDWIARYRYGLAVIRSRHLHGVSGARRSQLLRVGRLVIWWRCGCWCWRGRQFLKCGSGSSGSGSGCSSLLCRRWDQGVVHSP